MDGTYCEEFIREIVDKCHKNLVVSDWRSRVIVLLCRSLAISARVIFITHDLKHRQQVLFAKVIDIIIEEVKVQIDDKEGSNTLSQGLARGDLFHQFIRHFRSETEMDTAVLRPCIKRRCRFIRGQ